jgi:hypothetical protein
LRLNNKILLSHLFFFQNVLCKYVLIDLRINNLVSGEVPNTPVVSLKSGNLFEKDLIVKYVEENHKCPVTGEELTVDDLLEVKSIVDIS